MYRWWKTVGKHLLTAAHCRRVADVFCRFQAAAARCGDSSLGYLICRQAAAARRSSPLLADCPFQLTLSGAQNSRFIDYSSTKASKSSLSKSSFDWEFRISFNCVFFFCIFFDYALVRKFQFRMDLWIYEVEIDAKDCANVHSFIIMFKQLRLNLILTVMFSLHQYRWAQLFYISV